MRLMHHQEHHQGHQSHETFFERRKEGRRYHYICSSRLGLIRWYFILSGIQHVKAVHGNVSNTSEVHLLHCASNSKQCSLMFCALIAVNSKLPAYSPLCPDLGPEIVGPGNIAQWSQKVASHAILPAGPQSTVGGG